MDPGAIYSDDRLGFAEKLWITREYGLGGIWIRGEATVVVSGLSFTCYLSLNYSHTRQLRLIIIILYLYCTKYY